MKTKIAIGTLIQWYEYQLLPEYLQALGQAYEFIQDSNKAECITFDFIINDQQCLEKFDGNNDQLENITGKMWSLINRFQKKFHIGFCYTRTLGASYSYTSIRDSISGYRRNFNDAYSYRNDVLIWGEIDMLLPHSAFVLIDQLHQQVHLSTPRYISTFAICKMWDDSWKPLEHPDFTTKPFIENDYTNWWSLKYTMNIDEMNKINEKYSNNVEIQVLPQNKFNGCGLIISSELIKNGINIPDSIFFVHEDTAFLNMIKKIYNNIPQYHFKNTLIVHNRNHPKKRMHVLGETGDTMNKKRRSNKWYELANNYCELNAYNLFNPAYKSYTWEDVWKSI